MRCKFCGAVLNRCGEHRYCLTPKCQWHYGVPDDEWRCKATVYKRDEYYYTGRGDIGFEMHYSRCRCSRSAVRDGFCRQHQPESEVKG